ncbi:uncharacterized protein TRAVEDRAFT_54074 [Trametes versicolor FP-101664 SS1]|uniref:Uncharacterized protein n=1 Tax=Trametes versicolor (strain FP-101664) TaxID=717944 RepID=R7SB08_TRAVS|nr:uncharacterized protein TRAVEDRAFT_54074 [Trametes versicolor FP-101664 SS1]EIW52099.1 hypothetical protein TRAVEDRAFT_54074 [Trametes versicolor FP-101664 SS1]
MSASGLEVHRNPGTQLLIKDSTVTGMLETDVDRVGVDADGVDIDVDANDVDVDTDDMDADADGVNMDADDVDVDADDVDVDADDVDVDEWTLDSSGTAADNMDDVASADGAADTTDSEQRDVDDTVPEERRGTVIPVDVPIGPE